MLHRLSRTLREIHRLSREVPVAGFQDAAFEAMKELVRFDTGYWGGGRGPVEAVVMHYQHLHRLPAEETSAAFEKVKSRPKHVEFISRCVINAGHAQIFDTRELGVDDFSAILTSTKSLRSTRTTPISTCTMWFPCTAAARNASPKRSACCSRARCISRARPSPN